jgi:hypothetical protein
MLFRKLSLVAATTLVLVLGTSASQAAPITDGLEAPAILAGAGVLDPGVAKLLPRESEMLALETCELMTMATCGTCGATAGACMILPPSCVAMIPSCFGCGVMGGSCSSPSTPSEPTSTTVVPAPDNGPIIVPIPDFCSRMSSSECEVGPPNMTDAPEPASLAVFGVGLLGLGLARSLSRRKSKSACGASGVGA